jgi:hypothetical protein
MNCVFVGHYVLSNSERRDVRVTDDFESAKSHKTNSSCESQLQRELLAYESMEIITLATY